MDPMWTASETPREREQQKGIGGRLTLGCREIAAHLGKSVLPIIIYAELNTWSALSRIAVTAFLKLLVR